MGIPGRTCTGCRAVVPQAELVRLTLVGDQLVVDQGARRGPGRGAYVHVRPSCLEGASRGGLARSFRRAISASQVRGLAAKLSPTDDNHGQKLAGQVDVEAVRSVARASDAQAKE